MASAQAISARNRIRQLHFPDVTLVTHEGRKVRFYEDLVRGKIVTFNFFYATCDGVCPGITANLLRVQKLLGSRVGSDIFLYSITLKPKVDTAEVLAQYARDHHAGPGWLFLTGHPGDVERVRKGLGFADIDPALDTDKTQHIGMLRYGNEPLTIWAACPGLSSPEALAHSILGLDKRRSRPG
jgi:protein SCO1